MMMNQVDSSSFNDEKDDDKMSKRMISRLSSRSRLISLDPLAAPLAIETITQISKPKKVRDTDTMLRIWFYSNDL